jgi:nucleoside-diphosphate-sugar epimerase
VVRTVARRRLPRHPKLRHTCADLGAPEAVRALAGVEVLWHLAFTLWRGAGGHEANRAGTRAVLAARPGRAVLASSAAVYGAWPENPCPLSEQHDPRPNAECPYAAQKLEAERVVLDRLPAAVLRLPAVLGPHADPRVARTTAAYRLAVPAVAGARQRLQFLGEEDAAAALHLAGTAGRTGVCNIAPDDWLDAAEIARIAHSRVVALPRWLLLGIAEGAYRMRAAPFGADRAVLVSGPLALDPARAGARLGWHATAGSADVLGAFLGASGDLPERAARG